MKNKLEELNSLLYSIKTDIAEKDADNNTIEMIDNCFRIIEELQNSQSNNLVKPNFVEVIHNKKKEINNSLEEYLTEGKSTIFSAEMMKIIKENELQICDEILTELQSSVNDDSCNKATAFGIFLAGVGVGNNNKHGDNDKYNIGGLSNPQSIFNKIWEYEKKINNE